MRPFKLALCQITPQYDIGANVDRAVTLIEKAADNGAEMVALPEMFYYPYELQALRSVSGDEDRILDLFKGACVKHGIFLCTGSMAFVHDGKLFNRAFLLGPSGDELLSYNKCHMFDVQFKNLQIRESDVFTEGTQLSVAKTDLGCMGMLICYDIRFPEAARKLALSGAELLLVPAVFNQITGPAHWHVMMRARAIENQLYLAAISQGISLSSNYKAYGHSMVISPWGDILTEADQSEQIIYADINPEELNEIRHKLPLLQHRRSHLY